MVATLLHSHLAGVAIRVKQFRNGTFLSYVARNEYYDFNFQVICNGAICSCTYIAIATYVLGLYVSSYKRHNSAGECCFLIQGVYY